MKLSVETLISDEFLIRKEPISFSHYFLQSEPFPRKATMKFKQYIGYLLTLEN